MLKRRLLDYGLAAVLVAIPAILFHVNLKEPANLNRFDEAVLRISSPLQSAATWVVEGIAGSWRRYVTLVGVEEENEELRQRNRELRDELAQAKRQAVDSALLEELVELRRQTPADTIGARVVAADTNAYYRVTRVRLDRGDDSIDVGMPVIDDKGLVGRVGKVYGDYAEVLMLSDPASSIDVFVERTGSHGALRGLGRDDSYACEIEMLERGEGEVQVGDMVVTSGLGEFPRGLPVGRITEVKTKDYALFQEVEVEPIADLSSLRAVIVLLAPPPRPDPEGGKSRQSARAFGMTPY
ncbi:rod shape-determining protein MreC [Haliangium ochraceum]|uniref:Cell shape-determining protein MreC n=1 Tax=Haliangium ochraceum (strain DSM 14365 / JCM 11303 / SMP-2) TaxID=502025 RepID=D0LIQ0_HALO1|nr:rod shape-determining protein MreC [Haliangium ochraceum]ACY18406.1 rod shape-determining protein MreC [Haliangium ochraceum DSM 14365]